MGKKNTSGESTGDKSLSAPEEKNLLTAEEPDEPGAPAKPTEPAQTPTPALTKPVLARVPYPHTSLTIPGGGQVPADGSARVDLLITRQWTPVPEDQVQRVKDTARRARIKLSLAVPDETAGE